MSFVCLYVRWIILWNGLLPQLVDCELIIFYRYLHVFRLFVPRGKNLPFKRRMYSMGSELSVRLTQLTRTHKKVNQQHFLPFFPAYSPLIIDFSGKNSLPSSHRTSSIQCHNSLLSQITIYVCIKTTREKSNTIFVNLCDFFYVWVCPLCAKKADES